MRCCVRCSPISRSTSSPEVGSYGYSGYDLCYRTVSNNLRCLMLNGPDNHHPPSICRPILNEDRQTALQKDCGSGYLLLCLARFDPPVGLG
jgi:hypothetical protein